MKLLSAVVLSLVFVGAGASTSSASMLGSTVNACWDTVFTGTVTTDTSVCDPGTVGFTTTSALVVDPGVEFTTGDGRRLVDFTGTTVTVQYSAFSGSPSPDLFIFSLPGTVHGLTLLSSDALGITTAFSGSRFALLIGNPECCTTFSTSTTFGVDFTPRVPVPEPVTATLLTLGMAGIATVRARRRR